MRAPDEAVRGILDTASSAHPPHLAILMRIRMRGQLRGAEDDLQGVRRLLSGERYIERSVAGGGWQGARVSVG